jgi:hypothetical protein
MYNNGAIMDCKTFTGGYCKKTNMHVPRSWCDERCKYGKNLMVAKKQKPVKPTTTQMVIHFAKAMTKWISAGVPICSKEDYLKRRQICSDCNDGFTCPICGCQLWAKAALETEKCPNGLW